MSWRKLTQNGFYVHNFAFGNGSERVNIATVDTDVPILEMYFQSMLNVKICLQYGTSSATTLYELSENSLDRSAFSGCDTTSCFEGKSALKKHDIFSGTGFARHCKFFPTKTVLIDKIHTQSKVENIPTNYCSICFTDYFVDYLYRDEQTSQGLEYATVFYCVIKAFFFVFFFRES